MTLTTLQGGGGGAHHRYQVGKAHEQGEVGVKGIVYVGDLTMVNEEKGVFGMTDLMKASAEVLGNGGLGSRLIRRSWLMGWFWQ